MTIFARVFLIFWMSVIANIAIFNSFPLAVRSDNIRTLPLYDLQVCAKAALDDYQRAGPAALSLAEQHCHGWVVVSAGTGHVSTLSGRKLPPEEARFAQEVQSSIAVRVETRPQSTKIAFPIKSASGVPYIFLANVPRSNRTFLLKRISKVIRLGFISALFCYLLTSYLVKPFTQLGRMAEQLGGGDLKARIDPSLAKRTDEFGELGRTLNRMAIKIESLVSEYKVFLAHISHELGSPLTRLNIALALARRTAGPQLGQDLNRIGYEADRLNAMVQELLLLARLESGNELSRQTTSFDVASLMDETCTDANFEATQHHKSVVIVRQEDFRIAGHRDLLRRALDNILRNGVRFAEGGVQVAFFQKTGTRVGIIMIQDDGPGVLPGMEQRIFEPFVSLSKKPPEESGGSGLGLAIARQAVLSNRGTISAHNSAEKGLTVVIELPVDDTTTCTS